MDKVDVDKLSSFCGEGASLKGTLKFKGVLRFDGEFEGDIETDATLIVGASGKVRGNIKTGELYNFGVIDGNIEALNKISLHANSSLSGDINSPFFATEEGAHFHGTCTMPVDKRPSIPQNSRQKTAPAPKPYVPALSVKEMSVASASQSESKSSGGSKTLVKVAALLAMALVGWLVFGGDTPDEPNSVEIASTGQEVKDEVKRSKATPVAPKPEKENIGQIIELAKDDIKTGQYGSAIARLEEAVKKYPDDIGGKELLARTYQSVGLEKKAMPYFAQVAKAAPQSSTAINNVAFEKLNNSLLDDAERLFREILKSNENDIRARLGLASLFVKRGIHESAAKECDKILDVNEDYAPALNRLAWVYAKQGKKLSDALALSEKSLYFSRDIPDYIDTLSEVHYRIGDYGKAITLIRRAIALAPEDRYYERQLFKFERAQKHAG